MINLSETKSPFNYRYATLAELQMPILKRLILFVMLGAWLLMIPNSGSVMSFRYALNLGLLIWAMLSLWLTARSYTLGWMGLISGLSLYTFGQVGLGLSWSSGQGSDLIFVCLLPLIVLVTVLLAGRRAVLMVALVLSGGWIALCRSSQGIPALLFAGVLLEMWLITALFVQGMLPLYQLIDWSWTSFRLAELHLQELQQHRGQLAQALKQLDLAYHQLESLNVKLAHSKKLAEEERRLKTEFAANISHELRTPINLIIGFTETMLNSPRGYAPEGLPPTLMADLNVVWRNAQHLSHLIDDILDMSQITASHMVLSRSVESLRRPLSEALAQIEPLYISKGLSISCTIPDYLPDVAMDVLRIRQVLLNILSNAARFTERGGVKIVVEPRPTDILVSVADTGPGIASKALERIFEPFYQVDSSLRRRYGGTGLGLAISREIIHLHGGRMWAESQEGVGTTIYFTLPLDEYSAFKGVSILQALPANGHHEAARHLVVERSAATLLRHLRRSGWWSQISLADSLSEALAMASQRLTDAIVLGASFSEACQPWLARSSVMKDDTPIIVCYLPNLAAEYPEINFLGYLTKPILQADLMQTLAKAPTARKVLVVDDDPDMVRLITRWLSSAETEYEVWPTCGGAEAMALLGQRAPDLILLDIVMPEVDGYAILDHLKARPALRSTPVVVLSARDPLDEGELPPKGSISVTIGRGMTADEMAACVQAISEGLARLRSTGPARQAALAD